MRYGRQLAWVVGAMALCTPTVASAKDRHKHHDDDDDTAAAIIGGVALVGLAAALAGKKKKHRDREWRRYDRDNRDYYRHDWGDVFYTGRNDDIPCYRSERRCYKNGYYSSEWTNREFGYDPYPPRRDRYYRGR